MALGSAAWPWRNFGDYNWMWYADALLATAASICNLPIREARLARAPAVA